MASQRFCHHIHQNGTVCQSPPLRGRNYCYHHLQHIGRRMRMAKARARAEHLPLDLPMPEDLHSVQVAVAHVLDAAAAHRIDPPLPHHEPCHIVGDQRGGNVILHQLPGCQT